MSELINLFKTIAGIDSPSGEEKEVSDFVFKFLKDLGLSPIQDSNHMIYCRVGSGENPALFCAHLDTVEPGRGIKVIEKDGFLVSEGETILSGDNKVTVAAILQSVKKLVESKKEVNIELLFSVREETNSGISEFDFKKINSKLGFIFDSGGGNLGQLVKKAPTIQDVKITIEGKASHASVPEQGINVLNILLNLKDKIVLGRPDDVTTFNLGIIKGGSGTNTIPSELILEGDLRSSNNLNFAFHKQFITMQILKEARRLEGSAKVKFIPYAFGYEMNLESEYFKKINNLYSSLGETINPIDYKGGSDAGFLNAVGIETYCLGYGVKNMHSVNETIEIKVFEKLLVIIEELMKQDWKIGN